MDGKLILLIIILVIVVALLWPVIRKYIGGDYFDDPRVPTDIIIMTLARLPTVKEVYQKSRINIRVRNILADPMRKSQLMRAWSKYNKTDFALEEGILKDTISYYDIHSNPKLTIGTVLRYPTIHGKKWVMFYLSFFLTIEYNGSC